MTEFQIKVVSDNKVYPGGKNDKFVISWSPFYLDANLPQQSIPLRQRFEERYGPERALEKQARLKNIGLQEGIHFSFDSKLGNTRDSHRLIQLGKTKGSDVENRIVLELFKDYFEGDGDITSHETLTAVGVRAGLDRDEVEDWLKMGKGGDEVDSEAQEAVRRGIDGVPNFTVQGEVLDGADDPQAFVEMFVKVKEKEQA
ncbi:hypothetical protein SLS62_005497 [Diatrype stigma]|uniref:DSBA-like thioredoxin domain-containing protein n=1 Tax=Diatrype stigma TaxID=117547 RepID=A0AAN9UP26_9PEZI